MKDFSTNACWWNFKSQINFYKHDKKYLILFQITVSITRSWYSTTQLFNQYKKLLRSFHIDDYNGEGSEKFNFKMNSSFLTNFVASISIREKSQMEANFPGVDFLRTAFKFRKR